MSTGWAVCTALLWACAAAALVLAGHTALNAALLRSPTATGSEVDNPVAVLLPLRDEAHRVRPCLRALLAQRGVPDLRVLVLDDGSTDGTAEVVREVCADDPRVTLLTGVDPAPGWLGKPHACQRLADAAADAGRPGEVLAFLDADVVLAPDALAAAVPLLRWFDLVSPYPRIVAGSPGERLVQPLLQWSWLTFVPLRALERSRRPSLAVAGGQFMLVTRAGYDRAGGHAAVRDRVLEDVELARAVIRSGGRVAVVDGSRLATCRMYTSWRDLVDGYTKSLWASFGSGAAAVAVTTLLAAVYVLPALALLGLAPAAPLTGARGPLLAGAGALAAYLAGVTSRVVAARATGGRRWPDALAQPVSIALFAGLVARSYRRHRRGELTWKGRSVHSGDTAGRDAVDR